MAGNSVAHNNVKPTMKTFEDVPIRFRNFAGAEGQYNKAGDRNFCILLTPEEVEVMQREGWNVKFLKLREDETVQQAYLKIKVKFKKPGEGRNPKLVLVTSRNKTELSEEQAALLDWVDIKKADVAFNPYEWDINGNQGVTPYLKSIYITIVEDQLDLKYADVPDSAQMAITSHGEQLSIEEGYEYAEVVDD